MSPVRSRSDNVPAGAAPAVLRAAAVLDAIAASQSGVLSLSDIAREVGVAKSSTSSLCAALEASGLLHRDELGYRLGRHLVELGGSYLARMDVVKEFYAECAAASVFAAETLRLSTLAGVDTLVLARYEGHPALRLTAGIGDRFPASASAQGKVLLAKQDDTEVRRLYTGLKLPRVASSSITDLEQLIDQLGEIRSAGYAVDEQEAAENVVGLAVAVPTRGVRAPLLAVSVTLLDAEANVERRTNMVRELQRVAHALGNPMAPV